MISVSTYSRGPRDRRRRAKSPAPDPTSRTRLPARLRPRSSVSQAKSGLAARLSKYSREYLVIIVDHRVCWASPHPSRDNQGRRVLNARGHQCRGDAIDPPEIRVSSSTRVACQRDRAATASGPHRPMANLVVATLPERWNARRAMAAVQALTGGSEPPRTERSPGTDSPQSKPTRRRHEGRRVSPAPRDALART